MSVEKSIKRVRYDGAEGPGPGQGSHSHLVPRPPLLRMRCLACLVTPCVARGAWGWHVRCDIGWCPLSSMVTQHRVSSLKHWDQCKHSDPWSDGNWEMEKVSTETFINLISQKRNILCVVGGWDMILTYSSLSFQVMNNSFQYCVMNIGARTWIKMNLEWNYAGLVCLQNFILLRNMFVQTKLWCRFIWKHTIQI